MKDLGRVVIGSAVGGLLGAAAFFAVDGLIPKGANADTLIPAGRGKQGGDAYRDSSGTYWSQNTQYGNGIYGGASYSDDEGNTIQYRFGYCTSD